MVPTGWPGPVAAARPEPAWQPAEAPDGHMNPTGSGTMVADGTGGDEVTDDVTDGPVDREQPDDRAPHDSTPHDSAPHDSTPDGGLSTGAGDAAGAGVPARGASGAGAADAPPTEQLALFPLGMVLLPGLLLPLQIFEPRYRQLVGELLEQPEDEVRQFGVVAIRQGREVGPERPQLYEVGCTAVLRRAQRLPDGRYSLVTVGERRFVIRSVDTESRPYLLAQVTYLADAPGEPRPVAALVSSVQGLLKDYTAKLAENKAFDIQLPDLPDDPVTLSYLVAAAVVPDIGQRQGLLEAPDALSRLRAEQVMLRRELGLLSSITTVANTSHARIPPSLN